VEVPAVDNEGNYWEITPLEYFTLLAFPDPNDSDFSYLLNDWQREVVADMINETIVKHLGGKQYSDLEYYMRHLDQLQHQIRQERNNLGEIFQVKVPK
jgi:hypothetical protein